jgi:lysozyme family protein
VLASGSAHRGVIGEGTMPATQKTSELGLVDYAKAAADALLARHPEVVFTSGRRNASDQARAMSGNIVANRNYVRDTYADHAESRALQRWVDDHPGAGKAAIAAGLASVMAGWSDQQKQRLSRHFSGQAFDVQPIDGPAGEAIKNSIRALPNLRKFLEREAGLVRWHADFELP